MKNCALLEQVKDFILKCDLEELKELTLRGLTARFKVSKVHLTNIFKSHEDITPGKFILREKMLRAMALLQQYPDLKVKQAAEIMGFSSTNYFIRVFKDHIGYSPSRYREIKQKQAMT